MKRIQRKRTKEWRMHENTYIRQTPSDKLCHGQEDIQKGDVVFLVEERRNENHYQTAQNQSIENTIGRDVKETTPTDVKDGRKQEAKGKFTQPKDEKLVKREINETTQLSKQVFSIDSAGDAPNADSRINAPFKLTISMEGETKNGGNSDGDTSKQFQAFPMQNLEASIKSSVQTATKSNATPVRVQRKRTKGFKLQDASPNDLPVVYVGRPSKWGNPYKINQFGLEECLRLYELYLRYMLSQYPDFLDELKGKDLACWCPLTDKNGNPILCHADIIIKIMKEKGLA